MAKKVYKLDRKDFSRKAKKMRNVVFILMLAAFGGTMVALNALPGDGELPFLTILMVSLFLGLVFYFVFYRVNARLGKVYEGFALEIGSDAVVLRQYGSEPIQLKQSDIAGIGSNEQGGRAIVLKGEEGSIPIPENLEDRDKAIKALEKFCQPV